MPPPGESSPDESSLDDLRGRLAAIVDSSDDAIVSKTLDGVITSWNRGAERIFGWTAAEAVGRHITLIIPPERHAEEMARARKALMSPSIKAAGRVKSASRGSLSGLWPSVLIRDSGGLRSREVLSAFYSRSSRARAYALAGA